MHAARSLAIRKQRLSGRLPARATKDEMLSVIKDLAYVQWDPVAIVAPSHLISLWSRIGDFRPSDLESLLWKERKVFEHWTPIASLVLTEDYPIYNSLMSRYPESLTKSWGSQRASAKKFLSEHSDLRRRVLKQLEKGPLQLNQFEEHVRTRKKEDGWSSGSDVSLMLFHLHMHGEVMVVGHQGNRNVWGLSDDFLPKWVKKDVLSEDEFERRAAQRAMQALGTATSREIWYYFVRGRYQNLERTMQELENESSIHRVHVEGLGKRDDRFVHHSDLGLLDKAEADAWGSRVSLLPPFDNVLAGRDRLNKLFGFDYIHEQFLPEEKRRYGTYVLPIVWGSSIIGRMDMLMDRRNEKLLVKSVHAGPGAPSDRAVASAIAETVGRFGAFLGAKDVAYTGRVPGAWSASLR